MKKLVLFCHYWFTALWRFERDSDSDSTSIYCWDFLSLYVKRRWGRRGVEV